jgi:2-haloacid dehalogenase
MIDPARFKVLTFDCYGTLIDWETGIFNALRPILRAHGQSITDAKLLELYGDLEAEAEVPPYRSYREVLASVVEGFGRRLSFAPTTQERHALADSLPNWQPWADTVAALKRLAGRYRLAIISNIDDDLFAETRQLLEMNFDFVVTAQRASCYKPGLRIFERALDEMKLPVDSVLHVGQSIYHDVLPAQRMGLATAWVNRPSPRTGIGAVRPAEGTPDLEVSDLKSLADFLLTR